MDVSAVIGDNGVGKTTLMNIISDILIKFINGPKRDSIFIFNGLYQFACVFETDEEKFICFSNDVSVNMSEMGSNMIVEKYYEHIGTPCSVIYHTECLNVLERIHPDESKNVFVLSKNQSLSHAEISIKEKINMNVLSEYHNNRILNQLKLINKYQKYMNDKKDNSIGFPQLSSVNVELIENNIVEVFYEWFSEEKFMNIVKSAKEYETLIFQYINTITPNIDITCFI